MKFKYFLISLLLILFNVLGFAQVKTFNNSINNHWDEPGNWTPYGLPSINDSVYISQQVIIPYDLYAASAKCVEISTTGELIIQRKQDTATQILIIGDFTNPIGINNHGHIVNFGNIVTLNQFKTIVNHGTILNKPKGILDLQVSESSYITNYDSLLNQGKIICSRPYSNSNSAYDAPLHNEKIFINQGYILLDSMNYGGIKNSGGSALFINEDTIKIIENAQIYGGQGLEGIKNLNGTIVNLTSGYIELSTSEFGTDLINVELSILENFGTIVLNWTGSGGGFSKGIHIITDGIFRNEGFINIQCRNDGIDVGETGSFFQRSNGETIIELLHGNPITVEIFAILELEGILDIR